MKGVGFEFKEEIVPADGALDGNHRHFRQPTRGAPLGKGRRIRRMLEVGDGARGWSRNAPYDVIVLTGSTPLLDEALQAGLTAGGRLLAIVGEAPAMTAQLIVCETPGICRATGLFETCVPALRNAPQPKRFVF